MNNYKRKARRVIGDSIEVTIPPKYLKSVLVKFANKTDSNQEILFGLWINKNCNIEVSYLTNLENINGIIMFKRLRTRGNSYVIGIPFEIIKTLEIMGKSEIEYFNIINTTNNHIELIPLDYIVNNQTINVKERPRNIHLLRK